MTSTRQAKVLVTGGAGYIGSHMCVELLQAGYAVVVLDNFANASSRSLGAVERITQKSLQVVEGDVRDPLILKQLFADHTFDAVLHFAGLKSVGESVGKPALYYDVNVNGTLQLTQAMCAHDCKTLVFSSSATVYGMPEQMPIREDTPTSTINPYGRSKLMVEEILRDLAQADVEWRLSILRYFNPVGAHASGEIGEDPNDIPNNLMPFIGQVAIGRREKLQIFGGDYATPDGTGVRDYIHVVDLVRGHLKAMEFLQSHTGVHVHNLGTGNGYSVLEAVKAFEQASGVRIPFDVVDRRPGDAAISYADATKAAAELGWRAEFTLQDMCRDAWHWQRKNPQGFAH